MAKVPAVKTGTLTVLGALTADTVTCGVTPEIATAPIFVLD